MFQLIVANFLSNLLVSTVDSVADIALCQFQTDFVGIVVEFLANREDYRLLRSQPQRQVASCVFKQDSHETLHRAKWRTVNHHRTVFLIVRASVFQLKTLWQIVIHLNRAKLPSAANRILYHKVELRAIERRFAIFNSRRQAFFMASLDNSLFGFFPVVFRSDILLTIHLVAQ